MPVKFHHQTKVSLEERTRLKYFIPQIFKKEGKKMNDLDIIFCSDEYLLEMNRSFLKHDYYTDIITFDLSENHVSGISGELYVSIDRIKDNLIKQKTTYKQELHRVIFHGILHLCGYKDKSKKDIEEIRRAENKYLELYFRFHVSHFSREQRKKMF